MPTFLHDDVDVVVDWCEFHGHVVNLSRCHHMYIDLIRCQHIHHLKSFIMVQTVNQLLDLGVLASDDLQFKA
ncbi:hypothetical protein GJ496_009837 [Pomphorhynchus laevis]|nr:hypothetical protein GJ496_009837 [Pomphorhynchus laevis]